MNIKVLNSGDWGDVSMVKVLMHYLKTTTTKTGLANIKPLLGILIQMDPWVFLAYPRQIGVPSVQ